MILTAKPFLLAVLCRMHLLLNYELAVFDVGKLQNYCLSEMHPRGRHKARVFREALGVSSVDAPWLRTVLLEGIACSEATPRDDDEYGSRWVVDIPVTRGQKTAFVRTLWIIGLENELPRFITCWIL